MAPRSVNDAPEPRIIVTIEELEREIEPGPPPHELRSFGPNDFKSASSESFIGIARGATLSYASPAQFVKAAALPLEFVCQPPFRALARDAVVERVREHLSFLKRPFELELRSRFLAAQSLSRSGLDDVVLIETERELIVFQWYSTA